MNHNSVGSLVAGRVLVVVDPAQSVREAAAVLSFHGIGAAPVVSGDRLVGIFTERDILTRVVAGGLNAETTSVGDVMTSDPQTVTVETSLVRAFDIMIAGKFRHLPVVDRSNRAIAILSMRDVPVEYRIMHQQWTKWTTGGATDSAAAAG